MTWETEEESDNHSTSFMTTDTYGFGNDPVVWADDPEKAYFKQLVGSHVEDQSLIGAATVNELMEGKGKSPSKAAGDTVKKKSRSQKDSSGLSYYDTDAEDDTIGNIDTDASASSWFAAKREMERQLILQQPTKSSLPPKDPKSLASGTDNASKTTISTKQGAPQVQAVEYDPRSPISALSPHDKAGDGTGQPKGFAVPNKDIVPSSPGMRPVAAGGKAATAPGATDDKKIVPGYIFVTEGHPSAVQTQKSGKKSTKAPKQQEKSAKKLQTESQELAENNKRQRRRARLGWCAVTIILLGLLAGIALLSITLKGKRSEQVGSSQGDEDQAPPTGTITSVPTPTNTPTAFIPNVVPTTPGVAITESPTNSPIATPTVSSATPAPTDPVTVAPVADPTQAPTATPTTAEFAVVSEFIVSQVPLSAAALANAASPQYQATEWLLQDLARLEDSGSGTTISIPSPGGARNLRRRTQEFDTSLDPLIIQRWVLAVLFFATDGNAAWRSKESWLSSSSECNWEFVQCNGDGQVDILAIQDNGLAGTIPAEIGFLSESVNRLSLNSNDLTGTIPSTLGLLVSIDRLTFQGNLLTGSIPSEVGQLEEMRSFSIGRNNINGTIPKEIADIVGLRTLDLAVTDLTGNIPSEFGNLSELELFSLGSTRVSGSVPSELGNLVNLKRLKLGRTDLTGTIPELICTSELTELRADCQEVACPCCTSCCVDKGSCSELTASPTSMPIIPGEPTVDETSSPTPNPTVKTTSSPTMSPTIAAEGTQAPTTQPSIAVGTPSTSAPTGLPFMTIAPTTNTSLSEPIIPATQSPTATPPALSTPSPTSSFTTNTTLSCQESITTDQTCYESGEDIVVFFQNCDEREDDWVGVYADDDDFSNLDEPIAWLWSSGDRAGRFPVAAGNLTFVEARGRGTFRVSLMREGLPPYSARAVSDVFRLTTLDEC